MRPRRTVLGHVRTWRPYTLWYVGLVGLSGAVLTGQYTYPRLVVAWLVPTLVWIAAHYLGDYLDRDLDAISKPQRPIPSGMMSASAALACGIVLAGAACVIAFRTNWLTVFVLIGGIGGAVVYNGFAKAHGLWGNLVRGALTGGAFIFGQMMSVSYPLAGLLPFVLAFAAHDAATNLVGTLRDVSGDRAGGCATFAVRHGVRPAAWVAVALYVLAVLAMALGLLTHAWVHLFLLTPAAGIAAHAFRTVFGARLTQRRALRAHEMFVVERLVFVGVPLSSGIGTLWTLVIVLPMLVVTVGTQRSMRAAHEFSPRSLRPEPLNH